MKQYNPYQFILILFMFLLGIHHVFAVGVFGGKYLASIHPSISWKSTCVGANNGLFVAGMETYGDTPSDFVFTWDFGNGAPLEIVEDNIHATYQYTEPGTYAIILKVQGFWNYTINGVKVYEYNKTFNRSITITATCNFDFDFPPNECTSNRIDFIPESSFDNSNIIWDFGDGTIISNAIKSNAHHSYILPGTYTIIATHENNPSYSKSKTIAVKNCSTAVRCTETYLNNIDESYGWKSNYNWYFGQGMFLSFSNYNETWSPDIGTVNVTEKSYTYEGSAAFSDKDGNLQYFTNGLNLYDKNLVLNPVQLLSGNEDGSGHPTDFSSGVQGVLFVKHPATPELMYVFTVDDANSVVTKGFNYAILNMTTNVMSAPIRLGTFRTTEQLQATLHANKQDIWIAIRESGLAAKANFSNLHAYLLTEKGIDSKSIVSSVAPLLNAPGAFNTTLERGSLKFSWNGKKAATVNQMVDYVDYGNSIVLYNFDNSTGKFTLNNWVNKNTPYVPIAAKMVEGAWVGNVYPHVYDCEFTPFSDGLFVTLSRNDNKDQGGNPTLLFGTNYSSNEWINANIKVIPYGVFGSAIKLGPDGRYYQCGGVHTNSIYKYDFSDPFHLTDACQKKMITPSNLSSNLGFSSVFAPYSSAPVINLSANCIAGKVQLVASGATTYVWSPSTNLSSATLYNPLAAISLATTYEVKGTNLLGCTASKTILVQPCIESCSECVPSFSPHPGSKYILSAWVKKNYSVNAPDTYQNVGLEVHFKTRSGETIGEEIYTPTGAIIDGWQRVEADFTIPMDAINIVVVMVNNDNDIDAYFDDIRLHPFKSNMKSFVYDPSTQKLIAELDENNFATKYEYDDEGILIRVKKETERGVMTIKETRNNQSKLTNK